MGFFLEEAETRCFAVTAQGLGKIRRLAGVSLCLIEHVEEEPQLAQKTPFVDAGRCGMLQSNISYQGCVMHNL